MKWILSILALAAAVFWAREKSSAAMRQAELEQRRAEHAELEAQRHEHARLLALQPTPDELAALQRALAERAERRRAIETDERERRDGEERGLPVGEWLPQNQWQDRGQRTPAAAMQTMLWAAFGGDITRLGSMLHFDEASRVKLDQLYAALPARIRATYTSPEQLMAAFTAKAIPIGDAQLVWQQQSGPDEAAACVWINQPAPTSSVEVAEAPGPADKAPPMQPANPNRTQALIAMRRFEDGWHPIVPEYAIDKLARELTAGK